MKFNKYLAPEIKELLETQYKEYIKNTAMSKKEKRAVRDWVKDGNSVYQNPNDIWEDGQIPVDFLSVYRENEYLRARTKDMSENEAKTFIKNYFGWDDNTNQYSQYREFGYCYHSVNEDCNSLYELPF